MKKQYWYLLALVVAVLIPDLLFAQSTGVTTTKDLGDVSTDITQSFKGISTLIVSVSTLAGLGFGVAAVFKFKQHRDNPTQVPLGQPLALLAIAVLLLWINYILQSAGGTLTKKAGGDQGKIGDAPNWIQGNTP